MSLPLFHTRARSVPKCRRPIANGQLAVTFGLLAVMPNVQKLLYPFLSVYGFSYFFTEFGPDARQPGNRSPAGARRTSRHLYWS